MAKLTEAQIIDNIRNDVIITEEKNIGPWVLVYDPEDKNKRKVLKKFKEFADAVGSFKSELGIDQVVMALKKAKKLGIKGAA